MARGVSTTKRKCRTLKVFESHFMCLRDDDISYDRRYQRKRRQGLYVKISCITAADVIDSILLQKNKHLAHQMRLSPMKEPGLVFSCLTSIVFRHGKGHNPPESANPGELLSPISSDTISFSHSRSFPNNITHKEQRCQRLCPHE